MEKYNLTYDCIAVGPGDPSLTLSMLVFARFDCGGGVPSSVLCLRRVRADQSSAVRRPAQAEGCGAQVSQRPGESLCCLSGSTMLLTLPTAWQIVLNHLGGPGGDCCNRIRCRDAIWIRLTLASALLRQAPTRRPSSLSSGRPPSPTSPPPAPTSWSSAAACRWSTAAMASSSAPRPSAPRSCARRCSP